MSIEISFPSLISTEGSYFTVSPNGSVGTFMSFLADEDDELPQPVSAVTAIVAAITVAISFFFIEILTFVIQYPFFVQISLALNLTII